jgi:SAM-dependent MidA family methyltransferase
VAREGGAALVVDYGHVASAAGETLQAVAAHRFVHPLAAPGESDLTAHVDFAALGRAAASAGARPHGPVTQGTFLHSLGIEARAWRLKQRATPAQAAEVEAALARLTGSGQMGDLFKAMAFADPQLSAPPGFDN